MSHQSLPPFFVSSDITIQLFDTKKQPAKIHELIDFEIFRPLLEEARPDKPQPKHKVFDLFNELLATQGFAAQGGGIVDGTFIEVPRQRNTREENAQIKKGEVPESFQGDANKHKLAHKNLDACWTQKNDVNYFGHKYLFRLQRPCQDGC